MVSLGAQESISDQQQIQQDVGAWLLCCVTNPPFSASEHLELLEAAPEILQDLRSDIESSELRIFDKCAYVVGFLNGLYYSMLPYSGPGSVHKPKIGSIEEWMNEFSRSTPTSVSEVEEILDQAPEELQVLLVDPNDPDVRVWSKAVFTMGSLEGLYVGMMEDGDG